MKLLNQRQAAGRADLSVSTLKRLEKAGRFPRKVKITDFRIGYVEAEIDDWISERIAERDAA